MSHVTLTARGWFGRSLQNGTLFLCLMGTMVLMGGLVYIEKNFLWGLTRGPLTWQNFDMWLCMLAGACIVPFLYKWREQKHGRQTWTPATLFVFLLNVVVLMAFVLCTFQNLGYI